ncbi:glucose-1-phosphate thymidylyltransferase RfbA [Candidatus Planktophila versatilis]|uniref:Glucose-1-phosphate thymidylyltransferase n=1 Tax=Candidatus Planktophila versatilis TaxID=1884905 RepID=A0ABM6MD66_9ACTN|nr:glucose-1-phosphate thymidylyltransferase RfbA [Candidatus Planktophila versatilis]ASY16693.1 glucose-1-phosphate thymidylyltransferase [Candidatus Planktophila versatilis]
MAERKGIILAGGRATRMYPITTVVSKQLLPIFDKPMIYYPLSVLMLAGIREVLIIVNPEDHNSFQELLGDGSNFGIQITYKIQLEPKGIAEAFVIAEDFLKNDASFLILGDNLFIGSGLGRNLSQVEFKYGSHIFLYEVDNPSDYGNVEMNNQGQIIGIYEKPLTPKSKYVVPGLYICDATARERVKNLKPSARGELEITDLLKTYLEENLLTSTILTRGTVWLDTGSARNLYTASEYVRVIQERQGTQIACLEEIALLNGWITESKLKNLPSFSFKSPYGDYIRNLVS